MLRIIKATYNTCRNIVRQFIDDHCLSRAAALAYTSLLALVPLMTVSLSILAAFPVFQDVAAKIQEVVFANFVSGSADVVQAHIKEFTEAATHLSITGLFFLVITAVMMIFNMETDFNAIWHCDTRRSGVSAFLIYWAVLTLMPILIGVGIAMSTYIGSLTFVTGTAEALRIKQPLLELSPYLLTWLGFTILYATLPNCKVRIPHALIGGLVATVFFEMAKRGFTYYISNFPTYQLLYGALAAIPIFFVWVYLSWVVVLIGAVVTHIVGNNTEVETQ
ncbi:MAG: YihY family inner membrane protein [Pseudomonadota bacterium]|nr:YihY family inner membrane protein [Pseudomonadota bacterium]